MKEGIQIVVGIHRRSFAPIISEIIREFMMVAVDVECPKDVTNRHDTPILPLPKWLSWCTAEGTAL